VEEEQPVLSRVLGHAIELLASILMILMGLLAKKATTFFERKTKIDIPAKQEEMIAAWAGKAVTYGKEKAHQFRKEKGEKMKGPDKLEHALSFGLSLAEEHGLPDLAKDKLTKYIEAKLGEERENE
jgi:hypothetical protein